MGRLADPELAERRRRQILEAARTCFRRRGFHQASMAEICAEARLSPGALYRYFPSKTEIIVAIGQEERLSLSAHLGAPPANMTIVDVLCGLAEELLSRYFGGDGKAVAVEVLAEAVRDRALGDHLTSEYEQVSAIMAEGLAAARANGEIDPLCDGPCAARLLIAAIDGLGMRLAVSRGRTVGESVADFRLFVTALLQPTPNKPADALKRTKPIAKVT
jgi:AcrR family transcriptional regulator